MRERKHLPKGHEFKGGDKIQAVVITEGKFVEVAEGVAKLNKDYPHWKTPKDHMWSCEDGTSIIYTFDPYGDIHFSKGEPIVGYIELREE